MHVYFENHLETVCGKHNTAQEIAKAKGFPKCSQDWQGLRFLTPRSRQAYNAVQTLKGELWYIDAFGTSYRICKDCYALCQLMGRNDTSSF